MPLLELQLIGRACN